MQTTHIANPVRVRALRISEVKDITCRVEGYGQTSPDLQLRLEDGSGYTALSDMTARYIPVPGDYLVVQEDGYAYLNPKDVFERKYSPIQADAAAPQSVVGMPAACATPTPNPIAEPLPPIDPPQGWKPRIGNQVMVKGYIANGTDEHPGLITRVHGAGQGAFANVTAFPDLQSPKIFSSIPVYSCRAAADADYPGSNRRQNGYAYLLHEEPGQ
ncbi:hypothetical protein [Cupriavidus numazuensis]|uniref:Uncharacterized protein n=1 Tax=Cupriavidus numazuensis TaxID=221992 RepID=A0ABN7PWV0_9BURK|nr:hypothetical protein [Cupriavidus numazuensis]CAG2132421.1 hypothetical protein LMG26411_00615 [Cupriavidus numazuensis]